MPNRPECTKIAASSMYAVISLQQLRFFVAIVTVFLPPVVCDSVMCTC